MQSSVFIHIFGSQPKRLEKHSSTKTLSLHSCLLNGQLHVQNLRVFLKSLSFKLSLSYIYHISCSVIRFRLLWSSLHRDMTPLPTASQLLYCFIFISFHISFIPLIYLLDERSRRPHMLFLTPKGICSVWDMTY